MAAHEKKLFADELHAMSTALERAGGIASTLQKLHEAEVRMAVEEMRAKVITLTNQLANSHPPGALPQQIMEETPQAEISTRSGRHYHLPCESVTEDDAKLLTNDALRRGGRCGDMLNQASPKANEDVPVVDEDHGNLGLDDLPSSDAKSVAARSLMVSATSIPECQPADSENISKTPPRRDSTDPYLNISDLSKPHIERAASAVSVVSETPDPSMIALASQRCASRAATFTGHLRDIWVDAEQEPVAVLALRCFVNVVYYEEDDGRRSRKSRRTSTRLFSGGSPLHSATFSSLAAAFWGGICTCACGIMNPVGPTRFFWNIMCLLFIAYDLFAVPMQVFEIEDIKFIQVFEWILTIWWTFDMYMTFRTGYIIGAHVEMRPRKIAYNYASTWLAVDIIIVTIEWINRFALALGSASLLRSSRALRMFRCLRLFRASKILGFWQALQNQVMSNIMTLCITMFILGGILLLTIHVGACVWYAIGESRDDGWITYDLYKGDKDHLFWYMASFRWVIAQFNGRTDMNARRNMLERLYTCIIGVTLAVAAHAAFISFITKTMLDLSELVSEKTQRQRAVNEYLTANPLPSALSSQVKRCLYDYQDVNQELQKEDKVLAILPNHLQTEVLEEVRAPVLMLHPFFRAVPFESPWAMRMICRKVVQMISAAKDEVVFDKNDSCERMLFFDKLTGTYGDRRINVESEDISPAKSLRSPIDMMKFNFGHSLNYGSGSGVSLLECPYGKTLKKIRMGSWISEAALWIDWRNRGCLVSNGHGVLLAVGASKLAQELKKHPHAFALAYLHAQNFVLELPKHDPHDISDVLPFEVHVFSPLCLKITIVSASELRNADAWIAGKSDPYCVCKIADVTGKCGNTCFKTKTVTNSLDPVWNHTSKIFISWHQMIEFHIHDEDFGSRDEELGIARISPEDFTPPLFEDELPLVTSDGRSCQGSLHVKIQTAEAENPSLHHLWHPHLCKK